MTQLNFTLGRNAFGESIYIPDDERSRLALLHIKKLTHFTPFEESQIRKLCQLHGWLLMTKDKTE